MSLRGVLVLLTTLLAALAFAVPTALVLIQHDQAGPNLPPEDFVQAEWIRWPNAQPHGIDNRLLALTSGLDLQGELGDTRFHLVRRDGKGREIWSPVNEASLRRRGVLAAHAEALGGVKATIVRNENDVVSRNVLLIGLSEATSRVETQPFEAPLPGEGLVVYEAKGWDDVTALSERIAGRTLVVEYPPATQDDGWSRFWLRGAWPKGVPVDRATEIPGLVPARRALALLLRPQEFVWRADDAGRWGGANRWLIHGHGVVPGIQGLWFLTVAFVLAWALAQVMNEDRGPFVSQLVLLALLSPAAIVLAGSAARSVGLESWAFLATLSALGLFGVSRLGSLVVERFLPDAHPLWVPSGIGLAVLAGFDPIWSDLSGRFGLVSMDVPGQAFGAFVGYLAGVAAFAPGRWPGRIVGGAVLLWGATADPWWVGGHSAMLVGPAVAVLAAEGVFRGAMPLALVLLPTTWWAILTRGATLKPGGLLATRGDAQAVDFWPTLTFLLSPLWLGSLAFFALIALVGNRFLAYRLRQSLRHDPRLRALPWTAAGLLALGVTEPLSLPAAPILVFAAMLTLAYEGLRANA